MKTLITIFCLVISLVCQGQPIVRNSATTNSPSENGNEPWVKSAASATNAQNAISLPLITMYADANHTFTIITNGPIGNVTNIYTAPSSTTLGFAEMQMIIPVVTNSMTLGGTIALAGGVYSNGWTSPICLSNYFTFKEDNPARNVFIWMGGTNGYTTNLMMTDPWSACLFKVVTNNVANAATSDNKLIGPNCVIQGFTIMTPTNMPCFLLGVDGGQRTYVKNMQLFGPDVLSQTPAGDRWNGWIVATQIKVPPAALGIYVEGSGKNYISDNQIVGLAGGIYLNSSAANDVFNNFIFVMGKWSGGFGTFYKSGILTNGAAIFKQNSYATYVHGNFTGSCIQDLAPSVYFAFTSVYDNTDQASQSVYQYKLLNGIYTALDGGSDTLDTFIGMSGLAFATGNPPVGSGNGDLFVNGKIQSDFLFAANPLFSTDGNGNATAVSFNGAHTGNGSGLTNLALSGVVKLLNGTNIVVTSSFNSNKPPFLTYISTNGVVGSLCLQPSEWVQGVSFTIRSTINTDSNKAAWFILP